MVHQVMKIHGLAGRRQSPEHIARRSASMKKSFTPERRAAISRRFTTHGFTRGRKYTAEYHMYEHAKSRARESGIPFDIKPADVVIPEKCPLLGIPLIRGNRQSHGNSPSLDRIIPSLGYVKGNVWVISYRANAIKQDATIEELELLVSNLRKWFTK